MGRKPINGMLVMLLFAMMFFSISPSTGFANDYDEVYEWKNTYEVPINVFTNHVRTSDGGYFYIEYTHELINALKVDKEGKVEWKRRIGAPDRVKTLQETDDKGFIFTGITEGGTYVLKANNNGIEEWETVVPFSEVVSMLQTSDGGYLIDGASLRNSNSSYYSFRSLVKLTATGSIEWQKVFDGLEPPQKSICFVGELKGNGYILSGQVDYQPYIIKVDNKANVIWKINPGFDYKKVLATKDAGYLFVGLDSDNIHALKFDNSGEKVWEKVKKSENSIVDVAESSNGDITIVTEISGDNAIYDNFNLLVISQSGSIRWDQTFGKREGYSAVKSIIQTKDKGYLVFYERSEDIYLTRFNTKGKITWEKALTAGNLDLNGKLIKQTKDGFIVVGHQRSVSNFEGSIIYWIDSKGNVIDQVTMNDEITYAEVENKSELIVSGRTAEGLRFAGKIKKSEGVTSKVSFSEKYYLFHEKDEEHQFKAFIQNSDGSKKDITDKVNWESSSRPVVSVNNGNVKAIKEGHAEIKATYLGQTFELPVSVMYNESIEWEHNLDTGIIEQGGSIFPLRKGGFILSGKYQNSSDDIYGVYVAKVTKDGEVEWDKKIPVKGFVFESNIKETNDNGFILVSSFQEKYNTTVMVHKLDKSGKIKWEKSFNNKSRDLWPVVYGEQTKDSGYIVTIGDEIIKLSKQGDVTWKLEFPEGAKKVYQLEDESYIVGGRKLTKVDKSGKVEWKKPIEGGAYKLEKTNDGGLIVGNFTTIMKTDINGEVEWTVPVEDLNKNPASIESIMQTKDGGYILGGSALSSKYDDSSTMLIIQLDSDGDILWKDEIGVESGESLSQIYALEENEFIIVGTAKIRDFREDIYILKYKRN